MAAPGELDLATMLRMMDVVRRPGLFAYVEVPAGRPGPPDAVAMVDEVDTVSYIVPIGSPSARDASFAAAWLTLAVDSSLEAVGLTAAFAAVLAARSIPANVLAGLRHDHVLVPADRADEAIEALRSLRER